VDEIAWFIMNTIEMKQARWKISRPLRDGASDFELFFTHIVCLTAHRLVQLGNIPAVFDSGIKQKMNDTL
jgi:hypothetical protein